MKCKKCGKTGLKMRDVIATYADGKTAFLCRSCAREELGAQDPPIYFKKPGDRS